MTKGWILLIASVLGCGSGSTSHAAAMGAGDDGPACAHITGFEIDFDRGCYAAEAQINGVCAVSSTQYPSAAIGPVCLVGPDGATYVSVIRSDTELIGTGWANERDASTFSASDQARCQQARDIAQLSPAEPTGTQCAN